MLFVKEKQFYRDLINICLPIAMQSVLTITVNMLDTIMLGKLGDTPLSASSLANQFFSLYLILNFGLGGGICVLTAQFWGKRDIESIRKCTTLALQVGALFSIVFFLFVLLSPQTVMRIYTNEQAVIESGVQYLSAIAPIYLMVGFSTLLFHVQRSVGNVRFALVAQIAVFFTNLFFNYALIFGNFGLPRLEIRGAALATVIARACELVIVLIYVRFVDKKIAYRFRDIIHFHKEMFVRFMKTGSAVIVSDAILAMGNSAVSMILGRMGSAVVAGYSVVMVVQQISQVFSQGLASAGAVLTGNAVGRGEHKEAKARGITMVTISVFLGILVALIILAIRVPIVNFYNISAEAKAYACDMLYALAGLIIFIMGGHILTKGILRGGGDIRFLMVADVLFLWVVSIPLGLLTGLFLHAPVWFVFICIKCDEVIKYIWCVIRLRGNKWIRNVTI